MGKQQRACRLGLGALCTSLPCMALAQEPPQLTKPPALQSQAEAAQPALAWNRTAPWYSYWANQSSRWFASGEGSLGFTQCVRTVLGYGQPNWRFAGLEAQALSSLEFGALAIGPRIDALYLNGLIELRSTWAYSRHRPLRAQSYASFDTAEGPQSRYLALDASLWTYVPLGPLLNYVELSAVYVLNNNATPYALFEEYHRATLNADTGLMARVVSNLRFFQESLRLGPVADVVLTPGRAALVRVGAAVGQQFTTHLSLSLALTAPVTSPDTLPLFTQSWGSARISYSFATDEPAPGL